MMVIVANPRQFKIPDWFLNRQKDVKDGRYSQVTSSALDTKLRDDLERLKKIRCACGCSLLVSDAWAGQERAARGRGGEKVRERQSGRGSCCDVQPVRVFARPLTRADLVCRS